MRRLQPKIAMRLAADLAAEDPCPERFAFLLERLARLHADIESHAKARARKAGDRARKPGAGGPGSGRSSGGNGRR
jgi:hypothetical protein